ncbi:MAG: hypothetical protein SGJ19_13965 [Planctomycetia bacterium]|nr:hypothetical protein [Planctomycetia bacterium]
MPKRFDDLGIHFQFPDNWELDVEETPEGHASVSVMSPAGAFWTIMIHPRFLAPAGLADSALKALRVEYPDSDVIPAEETICGYEMEGFDLNFFYLDLTSTAVIRAFRAPDATYLIHCQAEDREYEQLQRVFQAITASLFLVNHPA